LSGFRAAFAIDWLMARKLKVFQASLGFFDLAIAAPSMKAALEAWGADSNLFHQGAASESRDPAVIAAAMAEPGVILKRPVGSDGPFTEQADLPDLSGVERGDKPRKTPRKPRSQPTKQPARPIDDKAARKAALAFEKVQKQRERERRRDEAARQKEHDRRQQAIAKAEAALQNSERAHDEKAAAIEAERAVLDERLQAENARWEKERNKLRTALRRARD
jgi:colicin import membrane protein